MRIGADVGGLHLHFRRRDRRELRYRKGDDGDRANDDREKRDHDGDDGAIDEEPGHVNLLLRRLAGDDIDDGAVSYLQQALDNDAFTGFQAVGHDPEVSDAVADRHRTDRHLVVAAHDRDLIAALQLGDGALRNQQGARFRPYGEADTSVAAGAKKVVRVRERHRRSGSCRSPR